MSRHYAKKADGNQTAIVKLLRSLGATWQHTHQIAGALDGIVGYCGIDQRVEIKNPEGDGKLTEDEQEVFDEWAGRPPVIIETEEDCFALLDVLRAEARLAKSIK